MKTCTRCKIEKPKNEFGIKKTGSDKLRCYCKKCSSELIKIYREENPEKIDKSRKKYRIENADKIKQYDFDNKDVKKQYRLDNKEHISKKGKEYYSENKELINKKSKEYNLKNKDEIKKKNKEYYSENKDEIAIKGKLYRLKNVDKIKISKNKYYVENKDDINIKGKEYKLNNKESRNKRERERRGTEPLHKLKCNIRGLIGFSIRNNGYSKKSRTYEILGCSYEDFKIHLEQQFTEGMTWESLGKWHLDHIIPISSAKTEEEVIKLNHYTNFQPLWAIDNLIKGNKY